MSQSSIEHSPLMFASRKSFEGAIVAILFVLGFGLVVFTYLSFVDVIQSPTTAQLLKADLVISLALLFMLGRRLWNVFSAHRKNMSASGLHMKLVFLFGFVSLVPAAFMAFFSLFFFHYGVQSWFSEQIKTAVVESNSIAESYLAEHQNTIRVDILAMGNDLDRQFDVFVDNDDALKKMMNTQTFYRNLSDAIIFDKTRQVLAYSGIGPVQMLEISDYDLEAAEDGDIVVLSNHEDDRVHALVKLNKFADSFLLVERLVDANVLSRVQQTRAASAKYTSLEDQSAHIRLTLIFIYIALSLFLVLMSIWFALHIAKRFIRPIENLVDASNRVRAGDLDVELKGETGVAELDQLTEAYNRMTTQLSKQRGDLVSANRQLDERRIFMETVLAGVSSGVLSVDKNGIIKLYNAFAKSVLKQGDKDLIGLHVADVIPEIDHVLKAILLDVVGDEENFNIEIPYLDINGSKRDLLLRAVPEVLGTKNIGAIITFDDITDLKSAQRSAAWSDVARRIAHEIKNPLTPIQLSADRIRKRFSKYIPEDDREVFEVCIETISRHVDDIGAMVSEFSSFARMPEAKIARTDLASLVKQCVVLHQEVYPQVEIRLQGLLLEENAVYGYIDQQLVRQAFVNILQNALDAVMQQDGDVDEVIDVGLYNREDDLCLIVRDSGCGFPDAQNVTKLLDPYVTMKKNGTGLGLAIVKKIMSDHSGEIVLGGLPWMSDLDGWDDWSAQEGAVVSLIFPSFNSKKNSDKNDPK